MPDGQPLNLDQIDHDARSGWKLDSATTRRLVEEARALRKLAAAARQIRSTTDLVPATPVAAERLFALDQASRACDTFVSLKP